MIQQQLQQALNAINLTLDPDTLQAVLTAVETTRSQSSNGSVDPMTLYACVALVGECQQWPSIAEGGRVRAGPTIESIMRLLDHQNKRRLLDRLNELTLKWTLQHPLVTKTREVSRTYAKFIDFMSLLAELSRLTGTDKSLAVTHAQVLWLVYLEAKLTQPLLPSPQTQNYLLYALCSIAFEGLLGRLDFAVWGQTFSAYFSLQSLPCPSTVQHFRQLLKQILFKCYALRHASLTTQGLQIMFGRAHHLERFLDDLRQRVEPLQRQRGGFWVNEVSFAEISLLLPPETIKKDSMQPITGRINLADSDDENQDFPDGNMGNGNQGDDEGEPFDGQSSGRNPPGPTDDFGGGSGRANGHSYRYWQTHRLQLLGWVSSTVKLVGEGAASAIEQQFRQQFGESYDNYALVRRRLCGGMADRFGGESRLREQRVDQMLQLFLYFVLSMKRENKGVGPVFFSTDNLDGTLCVSSMLFAHCYRWNEASFTEHCNLFGVRVSEGFKCINFIGRDKSLPSELKRYLYHVEGKLLLEQIWEDGFPQQIFRTHDLEYTHGAMFKRMQHHAMMRLSQISSDKVGQKSVYCMKNLMSLVMGESPPNMLRQASMNSIIVCCAANYFPQHRNLVQRVTKRYIATYAFEQRPNFRAQDRDGLPVDLQEFYQLIFHPHAERLNSGNKAEPRTMTPEARAREPTEGRGPMTPVRGVRETPEQYRERLAYEYEAESEPHP